MKIPFFSRLSKKSTAIAAGGGKAGNLPAKGGFYRNFLRLLFVQEIPDEAVIVDEKDIMLRHKRIMILINAQTIVISALVCVIVFGGPIMRPIYTYFTLSPDHKVKELVPLFNPNMTNQAILSWAATSVTEIMTLGFGDFDKQLISQRSRFTSQGWESFLKALIRQKVRDAFKQKQLILTTVPSDFPVITAQGDDGEGGYQWVVEMPVIMTYATNNNITSKSRDIIRLTIVRVPSRDNIGGIAIKRWEVG